MMEAMSMKMRRTTTRSATDISTLSALTPQGSVASSKASWKTLVMPLFINCSYLFVMVQKRQFWSYSPGSHWFCVFLYFTCITRDIDSLSDKISARFLVPSTFLVWTLSYLIWWHITVEFVNFYFIYMPSRIFHQKICLEKILFLCLERISITYTPVNGCYGQWAEIKSSISKGLCMHITSETFLQYLQSTYPQTFHFNPNLTHTVFLQMEPT